MANLVDSFLLLGGSSAATSSPRFGFGFRREKKFHLRNGKIECVKDLEWWRGVCWFWNGIRIQRLLAGAAVARLHPSKQVTLEAELQEQTSLAHPPQLNLKENSREDVKTLPQCEQQQRLKFLACSYFFVKSWLLISHYSSQPSSRVLRARGPTLRFLIDEPRAKFSDSSVRQRVEVHITNETSLECT